MRRTAEGGLKLPDNLATLPDGAVLATHPKAATALLMGGKLGGKDLSGDVMPYGDDTLQAVYIDAAAVIDAIRRRTS